MKLLRMKEKFRVVLALAAIGTALFFTDSALLICLYRKVHVALDIFLSFFLLLCICLVLALFADNYEKNLRCFHPYRLAYSALLACAYLVTIFSLEYGLHNVSALSVNAAVCGLCCLLYAKLFTLYRAKMTGVLTEIPQPRYWEGHAFYIGNFVECKKRLWLPLWIFLFAGFNQTDVVDNIFLKAGIDIAVWAIWSFTVLINFNRFFAERKMLIGYFTASVFPVLLGLVGMAVSRQYCFMSDTPFGLLCFVASMIPMFVISRKIATYILRYFEDKENEPENETDRRLGK